MEDSLPPGQAAQHDNLNTSRLNAWAASRSQDGAIMLADPVLGGNAACEPSIAITSHARERPATQDQAPTEDK